MFYLQGFGEVKFFLDENFPRKAYDVLTAAGYEVFDIRGTSEEGLSDDIIFKKAVEMGAVFLTTDRDFFHTIPHLYNNHCGIIVINLRQPNSHSILRKLDTAIEFVKYNKIVNSCVMLTDEKIYYLKK
jgi:predicted nuclease of predicted toxin-antitoxin system